MNTTKENKGVTLVSLVITIVILIIIAGVSIYLGVENIYKVKDEILLAELEQVQHFVGESYINYMKTNNKNFLIGEKITDETQVADIAREIEVTLITIPNTYSSDEDERAYYEVDPEALLNLGVENSQNTYIVNYITGEVINVTELKTSA